MTDRTTKSIHIDVARAIVRKHLSRPDAWEHCACRCAPGDAVPDQEAAACRACGGGLPPKRRGP